jgi:hypothetical protein
MHGLPITCVVLFVVGVAVAGLLVAFAYLRQLVR